MYLAFACRACGHQLYMEHSDDVLLGLYTVSEEPCPMCGETRRFHWAFRGLSEDYRYSYVNGHQKRIIRPPREGHHETDEYSE